jgi:hypothetical protein
MQASNTIPMTDIVSNTGEASSGNFYFKTEKARSLFSKMINKNLVTNTLSKDQQIQQLIKISTDFKTKINELAQKLEASENINKRRFSYNESNKSSGKNSSETEELKKYVDEEKPISFRHLLSSRVNPFGSELTPLI